MARLDDLPIELLLEILQYLARSIVESKPAWPLYRKVVGDFRHVRLVSKRWAGVAAPLVFFRINATRRVLSSKHLQSFMPPLARHLYVHAGKHMFRGQCSLHNAVRNFSAVRFVCLNKLAPPMFRDFAHALSGMANLEELLLDFRYSRPRVNSRPIPPLSDGDVPLRTVKTLSVLIDESFGTPKWLVSLTEWVPVLEELNLVHPYFLPCRCWYEWPLVHMLKSVALTIRTVRLLDGFHADMERGRTFPAMPNLLQLEMDLISSNTLRRLPKIVASSPKLRHITLKYSHEGTSDPKTMIAAIEEDSYLRRSLVEAAASQPTSSNPGLQSVSLLISHKHTFSRAMADRLQRYLERDKQKFARLGIDFKQDMMVLDHSCLS